MSVQREEFDTVVGHMPQDDYRAVVERKRDVRKRVHGSIERGEDRGSGRRKEIEPDVKCAMRVRRTRTARESRRDVKQSRLVVAADANAYVRVLQRAEYPFAQ